MAKKFKPQKTTMDTYQNDEILFFQGLVSAGVPESEADTAAKSITQYLLGYLTIDGTAHYMEQKGVSQMTISSIRDVLTGISAVESPSPDTMPGNNVAEPTPATSRS